MFTVAIVPISFERRSRATDKEFRRLGARRCLPLTHVALPRWYSPCTAKPLELRQSGVLWKLERQGSPAFVARVLSGVCKPRAVRPACTLFRRNRIRRRIDARGRCCQNRASGVRGSNLRDSAIFNRCGGLERGRRRRRWRRISGGGGRAGAAVCRRGDGVRADYQGLRGNRCGAGLPRGRTDQGSNDHGARSGADRCSDERYAEAAPEARHRGEIAPLRMKISSGAHGPSLHQRLPRRNPAIGKANAAH